MRQVRLWIVLIAFVFSVGCTGSPGTTPDKPDTPQVGVPDDQHQIYPEPVMQTLEAIKHFMVGTSVVVGDETFVIVSFGEQPSAGYRALITGIEKDNGKVTVTAKLEKPDPNSPVAEVLTYPYAVEVLSGRYDDVEFEVAGDYMPRIIGLKGSLKPAQYFSDNILVQDFGYDPTLIHVTGIARVFEGVMNYELRDQEGKVLKSGFIQIAAGGPDWGYFSLDLTGSELPSDSAELVLFQESAKDCSKQDEVRLPVQLTDS